VTDFKATYFHAYKADRTAKLQPLVMVSLVIY